MDIFSNEQITNDLLIANLRKQIMELERKSNQALSGEVRNIILGNQSEHLRMNIIRPEEQPTLKMEKFSSIDIKKLIELGKNKAKEKLEIPPSRTAESALFC